MKSIWKCRPQCGRHFDVGFINQALLAKVSLLDKASFCGTVKPQPRPENPTDKMKKMSIMANPIMSGDSLVFLTTAHNRAMSSHVQNRLSTDTYVTQRPNLLRENDCKKETTVHFKTMEALGGGKILPASKKRKAMLTLETNWMTHNNLTIGQSRRPHNFRQRPNAS